MKEITSLQHPLVKYWSKLVQDSRFRKDEARALLEGKNCLPNLPIERLIVTDASLIPKGVQAKELYLVSDAIIKKITQVQSPEGIIAELALPKMTPLTGAKRVVVADRIQDPGNLGTLIRSSLAFGWEGLFLLPGSVDPFNDKALRAAKGATFSLPLFSGTWEELALLELPVVVADTRGEAPSAFSPSSMALVLGNEAQGAAVPNSIPYRKVTLAMHGATESLNVAIAGSILLYLFQETR